MGFNNTTNTGQLTTGSTDFSVSLQLNNLYLYTATETDPTVISQLVSAESLALLAQFYIAKSMVHLRVLPMLCNDNE